MKKTGWYNKNKLGYSVKHESHRHALASKGIKTSRPKSPKGFSTKGTPTPNFDMVKGSKVSEYDKIMGRLGFHGDNRKIHKGKVHIKMYGKWHKVEKETIREIGKLHKVINKIESRLGLTAPKGKETIVSFGKSKSTAKGLKEVEKLPFIEKGFATKHKGHSTNIVFRDILDNVPLIGKNLSRKNALMYQDLIIAKEGFKRLKDWEVKEVKALGFNMESPEYYSGIHKNVGRPITNVDKIKFSKQQKALQNKINKLLYSDAKDKTDKEVLSIVLLGSKVKHFDFLTGKTRWSAIGDWQGFPNEKNVVMQVQFKDSKNEKYGLELMNLLNKYNDAVVGEQLLYARTEPIEESTL